ncbi:MAG: hypothetical protein M3P11_11095, partial [Actinomycetota bacterium]|nr:hypothetical protein [Actinomycetota bacterium]
MVGPRSVIVGAVVSSFRAVVTAGLVVLPEGSVPVQDTVWSPWADVETSPNLVVAVEPVFVS